jgi:methylated-DNA-[protein]-cysteine S-methyltransferase
MTRTHTLAGSPLGELTLVADEGRLAGLYFRHHWYRPDPASLGRRSEGSCIEARRQLAEYFAGQRRRFDLPLAAAGDEFQQRVWALVGAIPYGETATYGDLARDLGRQLGREVLAKDVGAAVGRNPLCVVVPCHRVVGKNGRLTGYAGGLARKRFLLDLEAPQGSMLDLRPAYLTFGPPETSTARDSEPARQAAV